MASSVLRAMQASLLLEVIVSSSGIASTSSSCSGGSNSGWVRRCSAAGSENVLLQFQGDVGSNTESLGVCHTAKPGEECYELITWAWWGIRMNPEQYPGLTSKSSTEDIQRFLHVKDKRCPKPCYGSHVIQPDAGMATEELGESSDEVVTRPSLARNGMST